MKKWIAAILAVMMVLSMAACGSQEPPVSNLTPNNNTNTEQKDTVSLGQMQGGIYTNTYAGFQCTLDENWTYKTAEELQELPDTAKDLFEGTAIDAELLTTTVIADMMAENATTLANINVQYQKLDLAQRLVFATATEEQVIDETLKDKDTLISSYTQAGMSDVTMEKKTVTFLGEERSGIYTTATISGIPCYIMQIVDYSKGSYGVTLTLTSYMEDTTDSLLALFTKV